VSANVRLPIAEQAELPSGALPGSGRRHEIHPADVKGRFHRARLLVFALLIGVWIALPLAKIGGHPAVFLDVDERQFFLFGAAFNSQDTWLLFFLFTGVGFGLVYATALAGRVWCGWACPQTVFLEGVFRRIERWIEGPREKRMRRNAGPWTADKIARKSATQILYVVASVAVAHIFLSYFVSIPQTFRMMRHSPSLHPEAFAWVVATTAAFYLNFAWFREQLCVVLCPYGRLQSALLDEHSLVVGYDARRGEPRGKKGAAGAGDCVDCNRCVVVCPTGIDIRNGVQMECLACTQCIDACDAIMDRLGRPRGLIRYDSQDGLAGKPRRVVRPRIVLYSVLLLVGAVVALLATRRRTDFEATLLRLPGQAPYTVADGQVRNTLQLHLVNKRADAESYRLDVEPVEGMDAVLPVQRVQVEPMASTRLSLVLVVPSERFHGDFPVRVHVTRDADARDVLVAMGTFLGPSR
jgi:cytochrome c oxidase accessory protein FixG